ncbi:MAG: MBL fold metallo-hydrolase [Anaerolineae bacterium]|nr:MBL fold metallo-hydrolase [Anaerolineae bacterium]
MKRLTLILLPGLLLLTGCRPDWLSRLAAVEVEEAAADQSAITVLYDNFAYDSSLQTDWGYAALVEHRGHTILFDTGAQGSILHNNMTALAIDPAAIEAVVLSHAHTDHVGGMTGLLLQGARPEVYLLPSFPPAVKNQIGGQTTIIEVEPGQAIADGIFTTGEIAYGIPEQALVIKTGQGLVIVTGCAHPGIVRIIEQVEALFDEPIYLVMGGFHLIGASSAQIAGIVAAFREHGIQKVAPSHCTGEAAIAAFAAEYGDDFMQSGVGREIILTAGD